MRIALLDNKDSFTYNLAHLLQKAAGFEVAVLRTDVIEASAVTPNEYGGVVISPGPGHPSVPRDFRVCGDVIQAGTLPILGVCLGHQGIAHFLGGTVTRARRPMHGRLSDIYHTGLGLFEGVPNPFRAVRYHSLIVNAPLPAGLELTAWTDESEVMAVAHRSRPMWGLQFHPESICTEHGQQLVKNFRSLIGDWRRENAAKAH